MDAPSQFDLRDESEAARRGTWRHRILGVLITAGAIVGCSFAVFLSLHPRTHLDPATEWTLVSGSIVMAYILTNLGINILMLYSPSPVRLGLGPKGLDLLFPGGRDVFLKWDELSGRGILTDFSQRAGWPSAKSRFLVVLISPRARFLWGWGSLPWIYLSHPAFDAILKGAKDAGIPIRVVESTPGEVGTPSFHVMHYFGH